MHKIIAMLFSGLTIFQVSAQTNHHKKAEELIGKMTLEEKVNLVVGMGMKAPNFDRSRKAPGNQMLDKVPGAAGYTFAIDRLKIPNTLFADGPAGLRIFATRENDRRTYYATAFPIGTLLACTWDTDLVQQVGESIGNEVKEYGVDFLLAPGLNIQRNALCGRNFEYYSEDPVVAGNITAAMVNGVQSKGVGTSIKHFAANNQETNRSLVNVLVSERALREIYLRGFEIAVKKSQPWTVMSSYNKINGHYTSEDYDLLTTVLRKEWKFKGFVMSDWFGGTNALAQMKAGNDLLMPGTDQQQKEILEAVQSGKLDEKIIDQNANRILETLLQTPSYLQYPYSNQPNLKAHALISRTAAAEGMVLLKNNAAALPFNNQINKIAAFGTTSYDFISGGGGSGKVNQAYTVSLVDGLTQAGYELDKELLDDYSAHVIAERSKVPPKKFFLDLDPTLPEMNLSDETIENKVAQNDVAIITIGRNAGEFQDRKKENDYYLSEEELRLIRSVSKACHQKNKKVVVIINAGGVIDVTAWRDEVDAILLAWQGGQEAGNAVADILSGKVNPSGKLTATFPMQYEDDISSKNFPGKNLSAEPVNGPGGFVLGYDSEVSYEEDYLVGYRYFITNQVKTAYEFGYGLSYTDFSYDGLSVKADEKGNVRISLSVTNTGAVSGKEVVQVYLSAPKGTLNRPSMELKAFGKTKLLKPGEKQTMNFNLDAKDLAVFHTDQHAWITDAGKYTIKAGASSINIKQQANFTIMHQIIAEKCMTVWKH